MDTVTLLTVRKPNGTLFKLRMFGDGNTRMTSKGIVLRGDNGKWQWQTERTDGLVIDATAE